MDKSIPWKYQLKLWLVAPFVVTIIWIIGLTCRVKRVGTTHLKTLKAEKKNWIISVWHENTLMGIWLIKFQNIVTMASQSRDGEVAVRVSWFLGHRHVRGSSSSGGRDALEEIADASRSGKQVVLMPDGPRGPKHQLKAGIISIAQKTGYPIIPFHYEADRQWIMKKSWDQHRFPKPFSKVFVRYGDPIYVPKVMTEEEFTKMQEVVEKAMMDNLAKCKELVTKK